MTDIKILSPEEISEQLKKIPGWAYANNKIYKEFKFDDFMDSLAFVTELAPVFEANDHHPDINIMYSKILFELQRFDIGGKVTDKDIETAHIINNHYENRHPHNYIV